MNREAVQTQTLATQNLLSAFLELTKPRLTVMSVATVALGFFMSQKGALDYSLLFHALVGSLAIGGAANALNQYLERDIDAKMKRTAGRPIPSGRLSGPHALIFGITLSLIGTAYLLFFVNILTAAIGLTTLIGYALIYTPLKQKTPLNTLVGAFVGALPILMGWTASGAELCFGAGVLFLILFLWQLPHFLSIAWVYREDYERGGLKMLTLYDREGRFTAWQIITTTLALLFVSLIPTAIGMAGKVYLATAVLAGLIFLAFAIYLLVRHFAHARRFILCSILYLIVIVASMIADKI